MPKRLGDESDLEDVRMSKPSRRGRATKKHDRKNDDHADSESLASITIGPVEVGQVAQGGSCVARVEGRVIFVRHALPGEKVRLRITDASRENFWLADAVEILSPSPHRVVPRCPVAKPQGCGGCDWQHATSEFQRELKRRVIAENLAHLASYDWSGWVEEVQPEFAWRTRAKYARTETGELGMYVHHSRDVMRLPRHGCAIACERARITTQQAQQIDGEILVVAASSGTVMLSDIDEAPVITEKAIGRTWHVRADGFWQIHPLAADTLAGAVVDGLQPRQRERAFDLYCGSGLFAGALIDAGCIVSGIETNKAAIALAKTNVPEAHFLAGDVAKRLRQLPREADLVVLDPPRTGAGRVIMNEVCSQPGRAIAYVACDPISLARDLSIAQQLGWRITSLRAFDLFPQTHHVECVAILSRA